MNGVDDIVFTAGIGENDDICKRTRCAAYLGYLGVDFDKEAEYRFERKSRLRFQKRVQK